jgi:transposase-like protein
MTLAAIGPATGEKATLQELADRYGIHHDSIYAWRRKHPEHRDRPLDEIAQIIVSNKHSR